MFRTPLEVCHAEGEHWTLTMPLVYEGSQEYFVIRTGFRTDFASIPKPFRWLFDSSSYNSEAGVLHDALWRESKRTTAPRVDPWDADGLFRQALRQAGATALARSSMWMAVRTAAIASGRFGKNGPALHWKLFQLGGMGLIGLITILPATLVVCVGLVLFWLASWIVFPFWALYERTNGRPVNSPWPFGRRGHHSITAPPEHELLLIIDLDSLEGRALRGLIDSGTRIGEENLNVVLPARESVAPAPS